MHLFSNTKCIFRYKCMHVYTRRSNCDITLKQHFSSLAPSIARIVNKALATGLDPYCDTITEKSLTESLRIKNYKPCIISKVFERVLLSRLLDYLTSTEQH